MKSAIFMNGKDFDESELSSEEAFEKIVKENVRAIALRLLGMLKTGLRKGES